MNAPVRRFDELALDRTSACYCAMGLIRAMVECGLMPHAMRERAAELVRQYDEADAAMDAAFTKAEGR